MNEEITANELGETVYFLSKEDKKQTYGYDILQFTEDQDEIESFAAVRPKFGRVVIFQSVFWVDLVMNCSYFSASSF